MTDPFLAEIRMFAGNYAPDGWALCNGQIMPISQNTAMFSLLGTTYGGDGKSTFGLPDLRDRTPVQQGQGPGLSRRDLGEVGGAPTVTLSSQEMATHSHTVLSFDGAGDSTSPTNNTWAQSRTGRSGDPLYANGQPPNLLMNGQAVLPTGGGQPHNNLPPYLTITFIIALRGIFPTRP